MSSLIRSGRLYTYVNWPGCPRVNFDFLAADFGEAWDMEMTEQAQYLSSVEHIMNTNSPVVLAGESIPNARAIIDANGGEPVAVVELDNTLKGVLTSEALIIDGYANASEASMSPRMTVAPHESAFSVVSRMLSRRLDWVPVVRQGKLVGTITRSCIKSAFGEMHTA